MFLVGEISVMANLLVFLIIRAVFILHKCFQVCSKLEDIFKLIFFWQNYDVLTLIKLMKEFRNCFIQTCRTEYSPCT